MSLQVAHADHLNGDGLCDCECSLCTVDLAGWHACVCEECDSASCGLHPFPDSESLRRWSIPSP